MQYDDSVNGLGQIATSVHPRSPVTKFGAGGRFSHGVSTTPGPGAYGSPEDKRCVSGIEGLQRLSSWQRVAAALRAAPRS
jgi:hypothetical protein